MLIFDCICVLVATNAVKQKPSNKKHYDNNRGIRYEPSRIAGQKKKLRAEGMYEEEGELYKKARELVGERRVK